MQTIHCRANVWITIELSWLKSGRDGIVLPVEIPFISSGGRPAIESQRRRTRGRFRRRHGVLGTHRAVILVVRMRRERVRRPQGRVPRLLRMRCLGVESHMRWGPLFRRRLHFVILRTFRTWRAPARPTRRSRRSRALATDVRLLLLRQRVMAVNRRRLGHVDGPSLLLLQRGWQHRVPHIRHLVPRLVPGEAERRDMVRLRVRRCRRAARRGRSVRIALRRSVGMSGPMLLWLLRTGVLMRLRNCLLRLLRNGVGITRLVVGMGRMVQMGRM